MARNKQKNVAHASGGLRDEKKSESVKKDAIQQPSKKQKQKEQLKTNVSPAFLLPYDQSWPTIPKLHHHMIMEELMSALTNKVCNQKFLRKKINLSKKKPEATTEQIQEILKQVLKKKNEYSEETIERILSSLNDEKKVRNLCKYFVFGINAITRHLEANGNLSLLLVCRSCQPAMMTQHLLCQCLVADIPTCALNGLSQAVSPILGLKSILAIGFKVVERNCFQDLIDFITDKIPDVTSPWVELWKKRDIVTKNAKYHRCSSEEVQQGDTNEVATSTSKAPLSNEVVQGNGNKLVKNVLSNHTSTSKEPLPNKFSNPMSSPCSEVTPAVGAMGRSTCNRKRPAELQELNIQWKEMKPIKKKKKK